MNNQEPIYHLLSAFHSSTLTHGTWLGSFLIAIFAFLGLTVSGKDPIWGIGSIIILGILCLGAVFFAGRVLYYSTLVTILIGSDLADPLYFQEMRFIMTKVNTKFKILKKEKIEFKIAYQFRRSGFKSIVLSLLIGFILGVFLFYLGGSIP